MNRTTTHPGDILKEELEARGITQKKFSEILHVPYTQLNEMFLYRFRNHPFTSCMKPIGRR